MPRDAPLSVIHCYPTVPRYKKVQKTLSTTSSLSHCNVPLQQLTSTPPRAREVFSQSTKSPKQHLVAPWGKARDEITHRRLLHLIFITKIHLLPLFLLSSSSFLPSSPFITLLCVNFNVHDAVKALRLLLLLHGKTKKKHKNR